MSLKANRTVPVPAVWVATVPARMLNQHSTPLTPSVSDSSRCEAVLARA
jgi:hypothetical protein